MHAQPSILPSTASPARLLPARIVLAALILGAVAALGLASTTRAADPVGSVLDAVETTPELVADALAPIVSTAEPVLDGASEVVSPVIETVEAAGAVIEPAVELLAPALELVPVADALAPVVDAVAPVIEAAEPIVPIVEPVDELLPVPLGPTLPVLDGRASDAPGTRPEASSAARIASVIPGAMGTPRVVRIELPPRIPEALVPHPASATHAGGQRAVLPAVTGTDAADLAVAGSTIGAAILLGRPPSRRAWLPDALGPPSSRTLTVLVPPG